jgi:hypothetical protein
MPTFEPGQTIETKESTMLVEMDKERPLRPGTVEFMLEVIDDANNVSRPALITITILDTEAPNAILDGPSTVLFGQGFTLSGERSIDLGGGEIVAYRWTRLR